MVWDLERSVCDISDIQSSHIPRGTEEGAKTYIRNSHLMNTVRGYTT